MTPDARAIFDAVLWLAAFARVLQGRSSNRYYIILFLARFDLDGIDRIVHGEIERRTGRESPCSFRIAEAIRGGVSDARSAMRQRECAPHEAGGAVDDALQRVCAASGDDHAD